MKATIAIPILLVAAIATMGFSAWSPAWSSATDRSTPDPNRAVGNRNVEAHDVAEGAGESGFPKRTQAKRSTSPTRSTSSAAGETDCPLLKSRPFRRTLGYPCLACFSRMEANAPRASLGSSRRAGIEADQVARAQAIGRLREHNVISAVDRRSSAAILWVKDGFASLNIESMQKVVDLVFTYCIVGDHAKNMLLIYDSATRNRIGTFTERRGLRMVDQLAKR